VVLGVRVLLEHGADVSATDDEGCTPLHIAAMPREHCTAEGLEFRENGVVVQMLLDNGADHQSKAHDGRTPESIATYPRVAAILKEVAERRARSVAFAMGQDERLGALSLVRALDPGVLRMILDPESCEGV